MNLNLSLWQLIANASGLVQFVMLLLLLASIWSWTITIQRYRQISQMTTTLNQFESMFARAPDTNAIFSRVEQESKLGGVAKVLYAGLSTYRRVKGQQGQDRVFERVDRQLQTAIEQEEDALFSQMPFLATVGSISPYIGLFGTVWGIMSTFRVLGDAQQATLSLVAPGLAEALIATAMGLFAAIPAAIAYNRFSSQIRVLMNRYAAVSESFIDTLHSDWAFGLRKP